MKYCFSFFLLSVCFVHVYADTFFQNGQKWTTFISEYDGCDGNESLIECKLWGDTIIDNGVYRKLIYGDDHSIIPVCEVQGKIYARINNEDVLLYDFGLQVGDSIRFYNSGKESDVFPDEYAKVVKVDTILLTDGRKAKLLKYDVRGRDIEFVGSEWGVLSPIIMQQITTCSTIYTCCSLNNKTIYESYPGFCNYIDLTDDLHVMDNDTFIHMTDETHLHLQMPKELSQAKIYTINGQCVLQASQTDIDVSALPQGMYILRALTADGQQHQAKFIKQ